MANKKTETKNTNKKRNIILFFIFMVIAMLIFDVVMNELYPVISRMILYGKYSRNIITEAVCAFIILIVLLLFKNSYIFSEKKNGFLKSLMVGGYITFYATFILIVSYVEIEGPIRIVDVGSLALYCLLIGIFEEFLCRGWIQNEFIERFANNRKEVILSIFLSALIFGGIHISNIWIGGQSVIETLAQIIQATGMGFLLGSIYYRTKNIWSVVFLHGYWDFALFLGEINIIKACSEGTTSLEAKVLTLVTSAILATVSLIVGFFILRKHKTKGYIASEVLTPEEIKKSKKSSKLYVFSAIAVYLGILFLPTIESNEVCYDYEEKHIAYQEIRNPVYTEYTIEELHLRISLSDNQILLHNLNTNQKEYFDNKLITQFVVLEEDGIYKVMLLGYNDYQSDTVVYYSEAISVDSFTDDEKYLKDIVSSFKILDDAPTTLELKYLVSLNNKKYFVIETYNSEVLVLNNDKFYVLVHQENTQIPAEDVKEETPPTEGDKTSVEGVEPIPSEKPAINGESS